MGPLKFAIVFYKSTYHTLRQNIQILGKPNFYNFSDLRYNKNMAILNNLENVSDNLNPKYENLAQKIFSETVCAECESKPMPITDAMGREIFWGDLGRPTDA